MSDTPLEIRIARVALDDHRAKRFGLSSFALRTWARGECQIYAREREALGDCNPAEHQGRFVLDLEAGGVVARCDRCGAWDFATEEEARREGETFEETPSRY